MRSKVFVHTVIFAASFVFFYSIQFSTQNIPGFDGYYHIKLASIIKEQGILMNFPWFQHTFWRDHFVDIHFLYHLLLVPFTSFDLTYGAKVSTVVFISILAVIFYNTLKSSKIPLPWAWLVVLFIASSEFLYRMSLPRAPLTALSFLFLGGHLVLRKNYKTLFFLTFSFVWLYGGFTLLIILAGFIILGEWVIEKRLDRKTVAAVLSGAVAGLVINPYFPENTFFLFAQTFSAGIDRVVAGGEEWKPYGWGLLLKSHRGVAWLFFCATAIFLASQKKLRPDTFGWVLFVVFTAYITFGSRRFIEYLVPALVMASALLFRDGWEGLQAKKYFTQNWIAPVFSLALLCVLFLVGIYQFDAVKRKLDDPRDPGRYKQAALWLKNHTPGVTIFNTDWDDFPELFFYNSKNRYVVGLDPAFLYLYDKSLYQQWIDISLGTFKGDPYPVLKNNFKTPYLFTDLHHGRFIKLMNNHPLIKLVYRDAHARIYSLQKE